MIILIAILSALKTFGLVVLKAVKYAGLGVWWLLKAWFKLLAGVCVAAFSICLFFAGSE